MNCLFAETDSCFRGQPAEAARSHPENGLPQDVVLQAEVEQTRPERANPTTDTRSPNELGYSQGNGGLERKRARETARDQAITAGLKK